MSGSNQQHRRDSDLFSRFTAFLLNRIPLWVLVTFAFAFAVGMGVGGFLLGAQGQNVQEEKNAAQDELQTAESKVQTGVELADENLKMCQDPAIVEILQRGGNDRVCDLAIVVQTQGKQGEPGREGERGPGPTQDQINRAVDEYFRTHPLPEGKLPTIEMVTTAVGEYLNINPPAPGRPPTPDEIAMATAAYLAEHAETFRGPEGKEGQPGPPPSAEDVQAAVAGYCAVNNGCRGPQGPQGVSITGTDLHRDEQGVCTLYLTWENPANAESGQFVVQVRDELCPPPTVTLTTPGG